MQVQVAADNRKWHHKFAMTSLPVEEPPSKTGVRLSIIYDRTSFVLSILFISVLLKSYALLNSLVAVAFFWDTLYTPLYSTFIYQNWGL